MANTIPLISASRIWLGIIKNAQVTFSSSNDTAAEMYLEYIDGTAFTAIGEVRLISNGQTTECFRSTQPYTLWDDDGCNKKYQVVCEFDCDKFNDV